MSIIVELDNVMKRTGSMPFTIRICQIATTLGSSIAILKAYIFPRHVSTVDLWLFCVCAGVGSILTLTGRGDVWKQSQRSRYLNDTKE